MKEERDKDENEQKKHINEESKLLKNKIPSQPNQIDKLNELSGKLLNFSDGLSTFSNLAITYYFKDNLQLSPSQSALFQSILSFPFILKPLFGLISDVYPLFGYKRKIYIIFNGIAIFLCWLILSLFNTSVKLSIIILLIKSFSKTFLNACTSAVLVEISKKRKEDEKKLENFNTSIIFINFGNILSSVTRGIALEYLPTKVMFFISGMLSCLDIIAGIMYHEIKIDHNVNDSKLNKIMQFKEIVKQKKVVLLLIYMLIMTVVPSYYESSFYYLTDMKGFTKRNFGQLTILIMILFLCNSVINKKYINLFKPKTVIIVTTIIAFLFSSIYNLYIYLDLNYKIIVFIGVSLYIAFKALSVKPIFNLAFLVCPKEYEGSIMGLFYSTRDFGDTMASLLGSYLAFFYDIQNTKYTTYSKMILTINLISLLPIFFVNIINNEILSSTKEKN
jgi:Na+/melibiose symporter-like transporter